MSGKLTARLERQRTERTGVDRREWEIVRVGIERKPRERTAHQLPPTPLQQQVLDALDGEPITGADISRATGIPRGTVLPSLWRLVEKGLVERSGPVGVAGRPVYWKRAG